MRPARRLRSLFALAAAACLILVPQGCSLLPDDGSGTVNLGECTGNPVNITIPAEVFCSVTNIAATISGTDMTTIDVSVQRDNPTVTLTIPSGPDRQLVVKVYTEDDPDTPFFTSDTYTFCVSDNMPVTVNVNATLKNNAPTIGAITSSSTSAAGSTALTPGEAVTLSVTASEPDGCDSVQSFSWSAQSGTIVGGAARAARGSRAVASTGTATWTPACPDQEACTATVSVTARDARGGTATAQATYQIAAVPKPPAATTTSNGAPTVKLEGSAIGFAQACYQWDLTVTATDPEGDALTYAWSITSSPSYGTLTIGLSGDTATWEYCFTVNPPYPMTSATIKVSVSDPSGNNVSKTMDIQTPAP